MDKEQLSLIPVALVAGAVCLAVFIPRLQGDAPVQAGGVDLLSLFFADARTIIGKSFVTKADSYFHGGVDMVCTAAHGDPHDDPEGHHDASEHADQVTHEDEHKHEDHDHHPADSHDPWVWINSRIHVQEHRHLEGDELAEMVPWLWAACRANPHNIEAYGMGWYALTKMQGKAQQGLAILEEGIRNNPDSVELEFTRGQSLLTDFKDKKGSEDAFLAARTKAIKKAKGNFSKLSESEADYFSRSLAYLAFFAKERGDVDVIRTYLAESEAADPDYVSTKAIQKILTEMQN